MPGSGALKGELSWADRLTLGREIGRLRQIEGLEWKEISGRVGRPQRTCQRLYKQAVESGVLERSEDAWTSVYEYEDTLLLARDLIEETYNAAAKGSAQAVGAIKQLIAYAEKRLELDRWIGRAPRQLGALSAENRMQEMLKEMAAIAERYDAPDEMVQAFLDLAERKLSGRPVIEGTASGA
jgi:chorismate mutase